MANMRRMAALAAIAASSALVLAACSTDPEDSNSPAPTGDCTTPVELTWWHNAVAGDDGGNPLGDFWQKVADDYTALHPNVTFKIEQIQNEDLQRTRIPTALQAGDAPDIFQQWGGGELADQVEAGYLMDLSTVDADAIAKLGGAVAPWQTDGKTYGLPFQFGVEGIWYRKSLFDQAGITAEPTTMDELNADVAKLKAANIIPIAVGAGDKWPAAHWWYNFALRSCSKEVLQASGTSFDFSDPCWVQAGTDLQTFIDTKPFQPDFTSTVAQTGATSSAGLVATGKAAMELMGAWNPSVYAGFAEGDDAKAALSADLGWFPMPATASGQGDPTAALGGGDGFSCNVSAPPECADFLAFIASDEEQAAFAATGIGLPANPSAAGSVTNENLKELAAVSGAAAYVQLWLDTTFGANVGGAMNDGIVAIFGGTGTPQAVVDGMTAAAATQ